MADHAVGTRPPTSSACGVATAAVPALLTT